MPPEDALYTESHEWARREDDGIRVGITKHAVEELQDLVYLQLKSESTKVKQGEPFGEVESVKAVADIYAPVSGTITEVNEGITEKLDLLYDDPFNEGWLIKISPEDESELDELMDANEYSSHIAEV